MTIRLDPKRPDESRRLSNDWSAFLGDDTIASQTTTSADVTISNDAVSTDGKSVDFTVSGGTDRTVATIEQSIVTAAGDHETETFTLQIRTADEPVSLSEAKDQLGVTDTSRDRLILSYIAAARRYCENYSGYIFVRRSIVEVFSCWDRYLQLSQRPVITVDSITYTDSTGADADYAEFIVTKRMPARIFPADVFPTLDRHGSISVSYTAGYAVGEVPEEARQAILMLVAHWFNQRESVTVANGVNPTEVPLATNALLDSFRQVVV